MSRRRCTYSVVMEDFKKSLISKSKSTIGLTPYSENRNRWQSFATKEEAKQVIEAAKKIWTNGKFKIERNKQR